MASPNDALARHCREIDRCNQRGGRMLSIVDLLDAETITLDLAAYSLAAISQGASFLTAALPGGAGKTTIMGALLSFVPAEVELAAAADAATVARGLACPTPRCCYLCHEIGAGPYYAYLWGQDLRDWFRLAAAGHQLASNLHADTYAQAREQICGDNDVPAEDFGRIGLLYFIAVRRSSYGVARQVVEVWEGTGETGHRPVYRAGDGLTASDLVPPDLQSAARDQLRQVIDSRARTIEEVRARLLALEPVRHLSPPAR